MHRRELSITLYRSLRKMRLSIGNPTVVLGINGTGKTNLYKVLSLLSVAANGSLGRTIAQVGGMSSLLWAGAHDNGPVRLTIACAPDDWTYRISLGLPDPFDPFPLDPLVKEETVTFAGPGRKTLLLKRRNRTGWLRNDDGQRVT